MLFLAFSVACAYAQNLQQMIILRAIQGFSGGVLIPMAFTIIITLLPKAKQPIGLALFALSATFAPAIGPTIGGYLTENFGWQYIFYVNLVPGAIMLGLLWVSLDAAPMKLSLLRQGDWPGILTMAIGLATLQAALEDGNKDDWFGSPYIVHLAITAAISLSLFIAIELTATHPLLNLRLLARRNFGFGIVANFLLGIALYGSVFILPVYLSRIQGYNSEQIGFVLAWTGLPQLVLIPLVPRLMKRFDARLVIGVGFALFAASNFMNIHITSDTAARPVAVAEHRPRAGPGTRVRAALGRGDRGHREGECGFSLRAVQHDAQSWRRHGHRDLADLPQQARAVPLQYPDQLCLDLFRSHPRPHRRAGRVLHRPRDD